MSAQLALYDQAAAFERLVVLTQRDSEALQLAGNAPASWRDPRTGARYQIVGSVGPAAWLGRCTGKGQ